MPSMVRPGSNSSEILGDRRTELDDPSTNRLVADDQPALRQKIFNITEAQSEPEIEPYGVTDNVRRESMAGIGNRLHDRFYPRPDHRWRVNVSRPSDDMKRAFSGQIKPTFARVVSAP
jgi:hypothetical protein